VVKIVGGLRYISYIKNIMIKVMNTQVTKHITEANKLIVMKQVLKAIPEGTLEDVLLYDFMFIIQQQEDLVNKLNDLKYQR
tara:strand:+ start:92 stop:334 length:243 start_codon:yes stop_codon:yes gene_type:complete